MALDKRRGLEGRKTASLLSKRLEDYPGMEASFPDLAEHPGKTLAETMSDEKLAEYMRRAVDSLDVEYAIFLDPQLPPKERARAIRAVEINVPILAANIRYLRSIKRLPEFADFNPRKRYPLQ